MVPPDAVVDTVSATEVYLVFGGKRYRIASEETQTKFDELVRTRGEKLTPLEVATTLSAVVAKWGIVGARRLGQFRKLKPGTKLVFPPISK